MRNVTDFTFGVKNYENYWGFRKATGDVTQTRIHRRIAELIRAYVPKGVAVLDCGVGPAVYFRDLSSDYEMHGIEFSEQAISLYDFDRSKIVAFDLNNGLPAAF